MITGGLSCDRVEFGHFGGGQMTPLTPPPATGLQWELQQRCDNWLGRNENISFEYPKNAIRKN